MDANGKELNSLHGRKVKNHEAKRFVAMDTF